MDLNYVIIIDSELAVLLTDGWEIKLRVRLN